MYTSRSNIRYYGSLLLSCLLTASTTVGMAQDPKPKQNDCKRAQTVSVPCTGVLLPTKAANQGAQCIEIDLPKERLAHEYTEQNCSTDKRLLNLDLELKSALLSIEQAENLKLQDDIKRIADSVKKGPEPTWYENPYLWTAVGFLGGFGVYWVGNQVFSD